MCSTRVITTKTDQIAPLIAAEEEHILCVTKEWHLKVVYLRDVSEYA